VAKTCRLTDFKLDAGFIDRISVTVTLTSHFGADRIAAPRGTALARDTLRNALPPLVRKDCASALKVVPLSKVVCL
jgi:hypothetical protein